MSGLVSEILLCMAHQHCVEWVLSSYIAIVDSSQMKVMVIT